VDHSVPAWAAKANRNFALKQKKGGQGKKTMRSRDEIPRRGRFVQVSASSGAPTLKLWEATECADTRRDSGRTKNEKNSGLAGLT